jgi:putative FmdB family regulatory protein
MPTYVYACDTCGAQFEQFQSFKDEPLRTCPSCAGAVRRVFQPVGIVFKGSGWYITDSRKSGSATVSADDSAGKAEKPAAGDSSAKSETTPAPASETKSSSESKPTA